MQSASLKKLLIVVAVVVIIAIPICAKLLGLDNYLFITLKESRAFLAALYAQHTLTVLVLYALCYTLVTAFSIPGAVPLSLAGGALFGLWTGVVLVSFASTIGATLACLVSRYLLRDRVQHHFKDKLKPINDGFAREGGFYLFSLRLIPIFPFFVINLVMGLTPIPIRTFYWVSQLGMLPATVLYVNAGNKLAAIDSPSGILSPGLLLSFALLGLFPITAKKTLSWYRKHTYSRIKR